MKLGYFDSRLFAHFNYFPVRLFEFIEYDLFANNILVNLSIIRLISRLIIDIGYLTLRNLQKYI